MAISFADSLKSQQVMKNETLAVVINDTKSNVSVISETDNWILDERYVLYPDYDDTDMCIIDEMKNIYISPTQINISKEANSQFIPFEMNRYYDGFDLTTTNISFYFINAEGTDGEDVPINVYYNDEKIKFGWLIDNRVTAATGQIKFEVHASGKNSKDEPYKWKSRICSVLNVLPSILDE